MSLLPRLPRLALVCAATLAVAAQDARAARSVPVTVQDDALFLHGTDDQLAEGMRRARDLGFSRVRLTAGWSVIAPAPDVSPAPDFDAEDPAAYPDGAWNNLDRAVRAAHAAGLAPMIDIAFWAPRWATDEVALRDRYRREIDPRRFAEFARAVATRYAGGYAPPAAERNEAAPVPEETGDLLGQILGRPQPPPAEDPPAAPKASEPLPAVDMFTLWNEPNHDGFLQPQWRREGGEWRARSPHLYRAMVQAAYPSVKAAAPASTVLVGATAAMGSSRPGNGTMTPGRFLRELACVDEAMRPRHDGDCAGFTTVPGDGWSHHPYSLRTTPDVEPQDTDKLPVAGTARLARMLRRLVDSGRLAPANARLYLTEYGYETNAPDPRAPFSAERQAQLLSWAEAIATEVPAVKMWAQFQLYDRPDDATSSSLMPFSDWQSGLYFADGRAKPAVRTWTRPVFSRCLEARGRTWALVWGHHRTAPSGSVEVERVRGGRSSVVAGASRALRAVAARAGGRRGAGVRRVVQHRAGTGYRLRWRTARGIARSAVSRPVGC